MVKIILAKFILVIKRFILPVYGLLKKKGLPAIELVAKIRAAVEDDSLDIITMLTDTTKDDKLLNSLRGALDVVAPYSGKGKDTRKNETVVKAVVGYVRELPPFLQKAAYMKIASLIVQHYNSKLKGSESDFIVQLAFTFQKHKLIN